MRKGFEREAARDLGRMLVVVTSLLFPLLTQNGKAHVKTASISG